MKKIILIPSYEPDQKLIELVKNINKEKFDIIIVNDGSNKEYTNIFNEVSKYAKVISYTTNKGKGYALKKGLSYIKNNYNENYIIITMDSDGQHRIEDAIKLSKYIEKNPYSLALGMRIRNNDTPLRSKIGNYITKLIYKLTTGLDVYDTQTGLRSFSNKLINKMLEIKGDRFEYEMNVLLECAKEKINIHEIKIKTIYIENNAHSHFKTIKDSYLVYKEILKFSLSSITSFCIDYLLYSILIILGLNISLSTIIARIISATTNYIINKKIVFKSNNNKYKSLIEYIALASIILLLNIIIINILVLYINKFIAKLITELLLFIMSLIIQKKIIFKNNKK